MPWPQFHHEAMATTFALTIADQPPDYARQAAAAAWRELDRLESELSRYVESSDIARANRLAEGASLVIGDDALQCLLLAAGVALATGGAFDPAYASLRGPAPTPFTLDPDTHTLTACCPRLRLDLGAVGKGYALDRLAATLREWGVGAACLDSGGSTALALAPPPGRAGWRVTLGTAAPLDLTDAALSGSGVAVRGAHLIDPTTGAPTSRTARTWALAPTAALADALSTAFFLWTEEELAAFCAAHPETGAARELPSTLFRTGALRAN